MIETRHLVKEFPNVRAVDDVSFAVERGEVFGLIGPNGAGKTTCLNVLATLLRPTSGEVLINGVSITENVRQTRLIIGYMPDFFGVYKNVTFFNYLDFYAGCYGIQREERERRIDEVSELTGLRDKRDEQVDNLSRGMKQRLCLAKTLIHHPKVLLLDEPASGLDPRARLEIRSILKRVAEDGTTIVISSHILSELENLCTDIAIMDRGRLRREGKMNEILQTPEPVKTWDVELADGHVEVAETLKSLPFVAGTRVEGKLVRVAVVEKEESNDQEAGKSLTARLLRAILDTGREPLALNQSKMNLENAYLRLTEDSIDA